MLYGIASIVLAAEVDGHRADTVIARAACALAALEGRAAVDAGDIARVAPLVLAHRLKRRPFDTPTTRADISSLVNDALGGDGSGSDDVGSPRSQPGEGQTALFEAEVSAASQFGVETPTAESLIAELDRVRRAVAGRTQESVSADTRGRYIRSRTPTAEEAPDIAVDATLRAAAVRRASTTDPSAGPAIRPEDVRQKVRVRKNGTTVVFAVDASGSMGAGQRLSAAKAAVLAMLVDAYQRRDRVGLVTFRGTEAQVVLTPTASTELAQLRLRDVPVGGSTPLASGIVRGLELLEVERRRDPQTVPWLVLVTDGRANVGLDGGLGTEDAKAAASRLRASGVLTLVIDTGNAGSAALDLARAAGGEYVKLGSLGGHALADAVRSRVSGGRSA
jgi:magnesium chelatase subunit D